MDADGIGLGRETSAEQGTPFIELGINRLARDLFLLTAVAALFMVMLSSATLQLNARRQWTREAQAVERSSPGGLVLSVHLGRDGRIQIGERAVATPQEAAALARQILEKTPALRDARVVLNTYKDTPSMLTSDVTAALADAGLDADRFYLRFTEE